jgi:hypothetical protein
VTQKAYFVGDNAIPAKIINGKIVKIVMVAIWGHFKMRSRILKCPGALLVKWRIRANIMLPGCFSMQMRIIGDLPVCRLMAGRDFDISMECFQQKGGGVKRA